MTMPRRPRLTFDLDHERERMKRARHLRVVAEGDWRRSRSDGSTLEGPWGRMMWDELTARFAAGAQEYTHEGPDGARHTYTVNERWRQIAATARLGRNPLQQVQAARSLLYRSPIQITGDISGEAWEWLRARSGLDRLLRLRHELAMGVGSAVMRTTMRRYDTGVYYPAGLKVVAPDECMAIADPSAPDRLAVYAEEVGDSWLIWDLSDPEWPRWGLWRNPERWARGDDAEVGLEGPAYPWRWMGEPIMPVGVERADAAEVEPLPYYRGAEQEVKDLVVDDMWLGHVKQTGSFNRVTIFSEGPLSGLNQWRADPGVVNHAFGGGAEAAKLEVVDHSLDAAEILMEMHRARVQEWVHSVDPGLQVRESEAAKSGVALLIEQTGLVMAAQEAETRVRETDAHIIRALIATHNYGIRSGQVGVRSTADGLRWAPGQVGGPLITEGPFSAHYRRDWNEPERIRLYEQTREAVEAGLEDVEVLWLLRRGLDDDRPDGPNWRQARASVEASLLRRGEVARAGYGVPWEKLWLGPEGASGNRTVEREASSDGGGMGLNGAQMQMALEIVDRVLTGKAPREVGIGQLMSFLGLAPEQAEQVMGEIGRSFAPVQPEGYDAALRETAGSDVQAVQTALSMQTLGYGAEQIAAFLRERGVVAGTLEAAPETPLAEVYTPPAAVSRTAARGLRLRDESGRGLDGMTPQGKRLLGRAKKLRNGDDFTRGEVLDLDVWLEAHQNDGDRPADEGEWGNDADPSAAWVEWLSQGGEDGLAWTNGLLAEGADVAPEAEPADETSDDD